jgi:hypothetical protein
MKEKGYVLYKGPSRIDGETIVVILTLQSTNIKTGNMAQLWIMREDTPPHIAKKQGKDISVCGDCPIKNECYVVLFQGPLSVYNAYKRGTYKTLMHNHSIDILETLLKNLSIRFGAYGDPAALPLWLINAITKNCKDFTGYTHSWKRFPGLSKYFMASVESLALKDKAKNLGFRTFRVIPKSGEAATNAKHWRGDLLNKEIVCPAENKGKQCIDCLLCNGSKQAADITITAHGARAGGFE